MRVLICGSRDWSDREKIDNRIKALPEDATVITGGARGADMMAASCASDRGHRVEIFSAQWQKHGRAAGPIRNRLMLDSGVDLVIAFPQGESRGTRDTITEARRRGISVEVHRG